MIIWCLLFLVPLQPSRADDEENFSCKQVANVSCPDPGVRFYLFTQTNPTDPQLLDVGDSGNLTESNFNASHPTKIIIHGYASDSEADILVDIRTAYLDVGPHNVVAVDWSLYSQGPWLCYPTAAYNTRFAGRCCAQLITRIRELDAEDIHVVGFSLGAQVLNYLALQLRPYLVPRLTGLDPAMPFFVTNDRDRKLDATDGRFVDVMHTNAYVQGKAEASGHADFYVNGGMSQPGCWSTENMFSCDHHRAPKYFTESIGRGPGFWGWRCAGMAYYLLGLCPVRGEAYLMGEHVLNSTRGIFMVKTASSAPFALGKWNDTITRSHDHRFKSAAREKGSFVSAMDVGAPQSLHAGQDAT